MYFKIWTHPREVIRKILDIQTGYQVWFLVILFAVFQALLPVFYAPFTSYLTLDILVFIGILISIALDSLVCLYFAGVGSFLGGIFGGKGSFKDIQTAYAWCYPPACVAIVLLQVSQIPVWQNLIGGDTDLLSLVAGPQALWQDLLRSISIVLNLWTLVLLIVNVSEAHQISALRSFVLIILLLIPLLIVGITAIILLVIAGFLSRSFFSIH